MNKTPIVECPSEDIHTSHLWTQFVEGVPCVVKCYGWTYSDEFLRMVDFEWPQWGEKYWGFDRQE